MGGEAGSVRIVENIVSDRGSRYAAAGAPVADRAGVEALLAALRRDKRWARATHLSWGAVYADGAGAKGDDGEAGAGAIILAELTAAGVRGTAVVVARWYGGKPLGGDRFRHVRTAARAWLTA